jgi:hypothetical protein
MVRILGLKSCWMACFQKLVKSGEITLPATISARTSELGDLLGEVLSGNRVLAGKDVLVPTRLESGE